MDLTTIIQSEDIFCVSLQDSPLQKVIQMMNSHIKSQEQRIIVLENIIKTMATKEELRQSINTVIFKNEELDKRIDDLNSKADCIENALKSSESRIGLELDSRMNEAMMATNTLLHSQLDSMNGTISCMQNDIKQIKNSAPPAEKSISKPIPPSTDPTILKRLQEDVINLTKQVHELSNKPNEQLETRAETPKATQKQFSELNRKLQNMEKVLTDMINSRIKELSDNFNTAFSNQEIEESVMPTTEDEDSSLIKKQLHQMQMAIFAIKNDISELKSHSESHKSILSSRLEIDSNGNASTGLGNDQFLENSLDQLSDDFISFQDQVITAMNAIADEFITLRNSCAFDVDPQPFILPESVPSFFDNLNNTLLEREDNDETGCVIERSVDNDVKPTPMLRTIPSKGSQIIMMRETKSGKEQPTIITPEVDYDAIFDRIKKEIDIDSIHSLINDLKNSNAELLSALDRKIDRLFVEKLFEKMRVIIKGLNDKVVELASISNDYALKSDLDMLAAVVKRIPIKPDAGAAAIKKGPVCLFCGRPKTTLTGSMSPRTASRMGRPTVGTLAPASDNRTEFVYGDCGAFKRDEQFSSFPNLDDFQTIANK